MLEDYLDAKTVRRADKTALEASRMLLELELSRTETWMRMTAAGSSADLYNLGWVDAGRIQVGL